MDDREFGMQDEKEEEETSTTVEPIVEVKKQSDLMRLHQLEFSITQPDSIVSPKEKESIKQDLLKHITEKKKMSPYYQSVCKKMGWSVDSTLVSQFDTANAATVKELDIKIEDARINLGETEVRDAYLAKAHHLVSIGLKDEALAVFNQTLERTIGGGQKIDMMFSTLQLALFHHDHDLYRSQLEKTVSMVEKGGDWERRNLLHIYQATFHVINREFKEASKLFLDSVATFTCYDLYDYNTFVFYAVLSSLVSLERVVLKEKVVREPEILSVIRDIPNLRPLVLNLYECKYKGFFTSLVEIDGQVMRDRFLSAHEGWFMREIRIVAYAQFLKSYRSVTLLSMANSFGVTQAYLDGELSRFIAAGRLNCKIDKVGGIVETNRPDARNTQYQEVIKHGDLLLNRVQKLAKVISF